MDNDTARASVAPKTSESIMQERGLVDIAAPKRKRSMSGVWRRGAGEAVGGGCLTSYVLRAEQCRLLRSSLLSGRARLSLRNAGGFKVASRFANTRSPVTECGEEAQLRTNGRTSATCSFQKGSSASMRRERAKLTILCTTHALTEVKLPCRLDCG